MVKDRNGCWHDELGMFTSAAASSAKFGELVPGRGEAPQQNDNTSLRTIIPIRNATDLAYDAKKLETYLLNLEHTKGGSKAKFLKQVLGYMQTDARCLQRNIIKAIIGKRPISSMQTEHGLKHVYHTVLEGKAGVAVKANVVIVIQLDNGCVKYRVITVYPN